MPLRSARRLLSSTFAYEPPLLLWGRAHLFETHVELRGWHLRGRYRKRIPLADVLSAEVRGADTLLLWQRSGQVTRLQVQNASQWQRSIEAHLQLTPSPQATSSSSLSQP
ncbi:MAG: hypothetical protein RhofKO_18860 [Rhodothermales bacterium]